MKVIDKQLSKAEIFFIILLQMSCSNSFFEDQTERSCDHNIGQIEELQIILAREDCVSSISLCNSNLGIYRIYPFFVRLDQPNLLLSYDTIYQFPNSDVIEKIKKQGITNIDVIKMDTMLCDTVDNVVTFNYDKFCNRINKYYKQNYFKSYKRGMKKKYDTIVRWNYEDCRFAYRIYDLKMKVIYGGIKLIFLPDFEARKSQFYRQHEVVVYYILDIESAKPIIEDYPIY